MSEESLMPERDAIWAKHDGLTPALAAEMLAFAGKMEMERNVWKHEAGKLSDELKKADEALEANITTFLDLRAERDSARACAVELRDSLCRPEWAKPIVFPWEKADPSLDSENAKDLARRALDSE